MNPISISGAITKLKDERIAPFREIYTTRGREKWKQFPIEGERLLQRALQAPSPIERVVYTDRFSETDILIELNRRGISHWPISQGLMDKFTASGKTPTVLAAVGRSRFT
jgi:tRNA G18 (ribose-2'-O)-methylase SpoU